MNESRVGTKTVCFCRIEFQIIKIRNFEIQHVKIQVSRLKMEKFKMYLVKKCNYSK
jgi:hypothetical protein